MELVSVFINIGIVIFMLIAYRQVDKNNRSLEKVKKYSSKVKEDLSVFIDEKSADIRNLAIEIKVNLQTHSEILKRMKDENDKLKLEFELVGEVKAKFQEYERVLKQLDESTAIVEENLRRIQDESSFVDKVGKQITLAKDKLAKVERDIPGLQAAFEQENTASLATLKDDVLVAIHAEQAKIQAGVSEADTRVQGFIEYMERLEGKKESMTQETVAALTRVYQEFEGKAQGSKESLSREIGEKVKQINLTALQAKDKFEKEIKVVESKYERHFQEISAKGIKMENEALKNLKTTIYENSKDFNAEIEKTFSELSAQVASRSDGVLTTMQEAKQKADGYHAEITGEIDTIKATFSEKFSHLKQDVNSRIETFIVNNREKQKSLTQELTGLNQFSEQKIAKFKGEFTKSISEITMDVNSFKNSYLEKLREAAVAGEVERDRLVHTVTSNIEDSRGLLVRNIAALNEDVSAVDELKSRIHGRIAEIDESFSLHNKEITRKLETFREDVEAGIAQSSTEIEAKVLNRLEQRLAEYEATSNYRIDKIEEINLDINKLQDNMQELLTSKQADLSREFQGFLATAQAQREGEELKTRELIGGLNREMQELETGLQELKTRAYDNVSQKLKVFEDEFFSDLTSRNAEMETKLDSWQAGVQQNVQAIGQKYVAEQQHMEEKYQKALSEKLATLKARAEGSITKLKDAIKGDISGARDYATQLAGDVEKIGDEIKARYVKMKEAAGAESKTVELAVKKIRQDIVDWKKQFAAEVEAATAAGTKERQLLEAEYLKSLEGKLVTLETKSAAGILALQEKLKGDFAGARVHAEKLAGEVSRISEDVKAGYLQLKKQTGLEHEEVREAIEVIRREVVGWKKSLQDEFQVLAAAGVKERRDLEVQFTKLFSGEVARLQESTVGQIGALQKKFGTDLAATRAEADKIASEAEKIASELKARYLQLQKEMNLGNEDIQGMLGDIRLDVEGWKKKFKADIESIAAGSTAERVKLEVSYKQELSGYQATIAAGLSMGEEKLARMQSEFQSSLELRRGELNKELLSLHKSVQGEIGKIIHDFAKQREDLVLETSEERVRMKTELKDFAQRLAEFNQNLKSRSKTTLEEFSHQYKELKADMINTIGEFREDVHQRINGFKDALNASQSSMTDTQKENMLKFEGEHKALRDKLKLIDRAQQNFVEQTKLFDRADTLKNQLKTTIEELKADISKLEPERQKVYAVESELVKTRKSADEVNAKLVRFLAEKRRIDGMERDFVKLIRISNDIGVKLESVTATHDVLQEIQARMRELGKLENDVDLKYERLEKKAELIDTTSKGIDRNFQALHDFDARLKSLLEEYQVLPPRIGELKKELGVLLANKPKTESVLSNLAKLDGVMEDVEQRMEKLQAAREWLSRTETRLENIGKEAGEQVKLMQTIIKADTTKGSAKGAPPADKRDTIIKLANQGWSVKEISRATNISQGEVELILELAPAKR